MIDFSKIEQYRENNRIEAKKALGGLPRSIWETYSAFANTHGGIILLGVEEWADKSLHTVDLPDPDRLIKEFWDIVNNPNKTSVNVLSSKDVFVQEVDGDHIVIINVPRAERSYKPVYVDGNPLCTYRRNGEGDYRCTKEKYQAMVRDASVKTQDMLVLNEMDLTVFSQESVRSYRQRMRLSRPGHVWEALEDEDFLLKMGAVGIGSDGKKHPTSAGLLMFGNEYDIVREFNAYFLDYQEQYDADTRWTDRIISSSGDWSGNVYDFYFRVYNKLIQDIKEQMQIYAQTQDALSIVDSVSSDKEDLLNIIESAKAKILDLAIRGQLVPQDPTDEPASVLLERIRAEKEELIKQGKIKRDKKESVIFRGEDNSYYLKTGELVESLEDWDFEELPGGWSVCCLGELCDYGNCTNIDTADIADSAWILDLEDIEKNSGIVLQKVRQGERNAGSTKHRFHKGQVLYSKLRPYLNKVVLADEDGYCTSEILPLEFEWNILPQYARYFLMSPTFLRYANKCSYGVKMPRLGTADGKKAIILVPPLEEQKRIVIAIEQTFSQLAFITENLS